MNSTIQRPTWPLLAVFSAVAVGLYLAFGFDILSAFIGGASPGLMLANTAVIDLKPLIEQIGAAVQGLKTRTEADIKAMRDDLERVESKGNLAGLVGNGPGDTDGGKVLTVKLRGGKEAKLLSKGARLAPAGIQSAGLDLAGFVADQVLGGRDGVKAVSRGPSLVDTNLAGIIIDDVRAQTVIGSAGAPTLVIQGPVTATRITGDATVYQHTEGANDISVSDVTTDGVLLDPKALVARVPLTAELVEDSANLEQALRTALSGAFAAKLDALCLATILADANVPKSAAGQDPALWLKCLEAVGAAMGAKQLLPTAMICNTADFIARASQLASTAGSWLGKPPALADMTELPTTALAAGTALYGGFELAFMQVIRQELRLEVIRFHDPGRYSHELVAHMRADGVLVQPKRLFKQLKTVP